MISMRGTRIRKDGRGKENLGQQAPLGAIRKKHKKTGEKQSGR